MAIIMPYLTIPIASFWDMHVNLYFSSSIVLKRVVGCIPRSIVILGYYTVYSCYTAGVYGTTITLEYSTDR